MMWEIPTISLRFPAPPPALYPMSLKFLRVADKRQDQFFCDKIGGIGALRSKGLPLGGQRRDPLSADFEMK